MVKRMVNNNFRYSRLGIPNSLDFWYISSRFG